MGMEITGKIFKAFATVQVSERFKKREFVVEFDDNPKYPQFVQFQLTGDRCEQLDNIGAGDEVRIEFSLRGREWTSPAGEKKYFNTLDVWKLERKSAAVRPAPAQPTLPPSGSVAAPPPIDDGDVPFASCDINDEPSPIAKVLR